MDRFSRTELLLGSSSMEKLKRCRVAVFGVGGVGGYVVEALVRSGIGTIDLIDNDTVSKSNINRQIIATEKTIGMQKVLVAENRAKEINPNVTIYTHNVFFSEETKPSFDFSSYDYVVDAIDSVASKLCLIETAYNKNIPIISSMGAGNKLDPTAFEVADIYKTSVCPLARVVRTELKKRGVKKLKTVYSKETPISVSALDGQKSVPGSVSFVPSVVGLIIAGEVIKDLIK